jgi:uncharacterized membrane protein YkoI
MFSPTRKTLIAVGVIAAFGASGAAFAGAATTSTSSSSSPSTERPQRPPQNELTGDTAAKVKAAAAAKVPGGTVLRVEEGGPDGSAYHAHVRKPDGTEVVVLVNASFEATAVQTRPARPAGDRDRGRHGPGPGGPGGRGREAALTGDTAAKVKAAAVHEVPGGTVLRAEKGGPDGSAYHVHVRKSDGTEVVVLVNASFDATSVQAHERP